ncbi:MAG: type II toxin-antitoxin system Phd/YefM family antitoxin [Legionellales bacterium]|jgi:prevent-host-death family protein
MQIWQLQDAKARLSELVRMCSKEGPQMLSVHGEEKAVLLSKVDYDELIGKKPHLIDFLRASPLVGIKLDLERDQSLDRDIDL